MITKVSPLSGRYFVALCSLIVNRPIVEFYKCIQQSEAKIIFFAKVKFRQHTCAVTYGQLWPFPMLKHKLALK